LKNTSWQAVRLLHFFAPHPPHAASNEAGGWGAKKMKQTLLAACAPRERKNKTNKKASVF
jgi:hypothetical protein